ncbi:tryptophan-rich sensory protein [Paracoccus nototheniae]|uniref:Tryptophan-rich sensory protein n=1 Tax=Paracoccus nototheniae TaxID=2489002 RepID=A0ABW4DUW9_9RHOB|nr:tryptophan-rich sensory protein [Paracoccus nototheniae]
MSNATLALLVLLAALAFAVSPVLFPGFAGFDPGRFPIPQDDPPVQPAGWAFSIWGVIYLWLILGAGFGLWKRRDDEDWLPLRAPLLVSLGIGFFWLPVASRWPGVATVMILAMLVSAIVAMLWAGRRDRWWEGRPIGLYAGWLTAASGVSAGIWLAGHGWLSGHAAAFLCLLAVMAVALSVQSMRPCEWTYPLAVIWALIGIIAANLAGGPTGRDWLIIVTAALGAAALLGRIWTNRHPPDHSEAFRTDPRKPARPRKVRAPRYPRHAKP